MHYSEKTRLFSPFTKSILLILILSTAAFAGDDTASKASGWLSQLDIYAKIFGGVITTLGALFGLPITILLFKKTKAEIRKLELEAEALENRESVTQRSAGVYEIAISGDYNSVKILADPRFLAPLLLLLDFIIAWIVLTIASYALSFWIPYIIRASILLLIAAVLLIPIFKEAKRVKSFLRPKEPIKEKENT